MLAVLGYHSHVPMRFETGGLQASAEIGDRLKYTEYDAAQLRVEMHRSFVCRKPARAADCRSFRHRNVATAIRFVILPKLTRGAPDRIRTCGLCLRRAALYPAELRVLHVLYLKLLAGCPANL